jgi:FtsZ-binding cell division protein ZapB
LNGARQSIVQIERIVGRLDEKIDDHGERITILEVETRNLKEDKKT